MRPRSESGQVAGVETLAFGVLVFVAGMLVAVNAWAVVTSRASADAVARAYLRAYTEAPPAQASERGRRAATFVAEARGVDATRLTIREPKGSAPCRRIEVAVRVHVPLVRIPLFGEVGATDVEVVRTERVDAYRSGSTPLDGPAGPCDAFGVTG